MQFQCLTLLQHCFPLFSALTLSTANIVCTKHLTFRIAKMFCLVRRRLLSSDRLSFQKCLQICKKFLSTNQTINYHQNGYQIVEPYKWTHKERIIRSNIEKPDYWESGLVSNNYSLIKNEEQIKGITTACKMAQNILTKVGQQLKVIFCNFNQILNFVILH